MYAKMNKTRKKTLDQETAQRKAKPYAGFGEPNRAGLPVLLRSSVESLSGFSMDDVRVHYNSSKPAQLNARVYTQGTDIHIAPGQERYLPHEAWHVVQQVQGNVCPTMRMNNVSVNDDFALEHEADRMGAKVFVSGAVSGQAFQLRRNNGAPGQDTGTVQRRKAILGRRLEPYSKDIDGFIKFCAGCGSGLSAEGKQEYTTYHIIGEWPSGTAGSGSTDIKAQFLNKFKSVDKKTNQEYLKSVNVFVKKKIAAKPKKADDYQRRVLNADQWTIEKNQRWIRSGSTGKGKNSYDSNAGADERIGIDNQGKFSIAGLEDLSEGLVFEQAEIAGYKTENKKVNFYNLRTESFSTVAGGTNPLIYAAAFEGKVIPPTNFIAYVINHLSGVKQLCINKTPGSVQGVSTSTLFPTVLAQEMEQLRKHGYIFAVIEEEDNTKKIKKVVALPREKAAAEKAAAKEPAEEKDAVE